MGRPTCVSGSPGEDRERDEAVACFSRGPLAGNRTIFSSCASAAVQNLLALGRRALLRGELGGALHFYDECPRHSARGGGGEPAPRAGSSPGPAGREDAAASSIFVLSAEPSIASIASMARPETFWRSGDEQLERAPHADARKTYEQRFLQSVPDDPEVNLRMGHLCWRDGFALGTRFIFDSCCVGNTSASSKKRSERPMTLLSLRELLGQGAGGRRADGLRGRAHLKPRHTNCTRAAMGSTPVFVSRRDGPPRRAAIATSRPTVSVRRTSPSSGCVGWRLRSRDVSRVPSGRCGQFLSSTTNVE